MSVVIVDALGFQRSAGKLASVSGELAAVASSTRGLAHEFRALEVYTAEGQLLRGAELAARIGEELATMALVMRERAKWARVAAANPRVRRYLHHILNGRHAWMFLVASALGGRDGLDKMSRHGLRAGLDMFDARALRELAAVSAQRRFLDISELVDRAVAHEVLRSIGQLPGHSGAAIPFDVLQRVNSWGAPILEFIVGAGRPMLGATKAIPLASAALAGLLQYWADGSDPLLTEEERRQRAIAVASFGFAAGTAGAAAAFTACAVTTGLITGGASLPVCGAATAAGSILGGGLGGSFVAGKIEQMHPGSRTREQFDDHLDGVRRSQMDAARRAWAREHPFVPPSSGPFDLAAVRQKHDEHQRNIFEAKYYLEHGYPPRDAIDRARLEEENRLAWNRARLASTANR